MDPELGMTVAVVMTDVRYSDGILRINSTRSMSRALLQRNTLEPQVLLLLTTSSMNDEVINTRST